MFIHLPIFDKKTLKFDAITLGCFSIVLVKEPSERLLKHEQCHQEQFKDNPITFYPSYVFEFFLNLLDCEDWMEAYRNISYERKARDAELL